MSKKPNTADALAFFSWCINITAELARTFGENPGSSIDPKLYESLKGLQLELDHNLRAIMKTGIKPTLPALPEVPARFEEKPE